jgi:putative oxidoreductase
VSSLPDSTPQRVISALSPVYDALLPFGEPLVRVTAGALLLPHGAQKLFGLFGGYGIDATGQFFAAKLGLPASFALLAGLIEFFGGLALVVGLGTRAVAALIAGMMAVAIFAVHLNNGLFWTSGGIEYPLMLGVVALSFVIRGGGRFSLDALIGREL